MAADRRYAAEGGRGSRPYLDYSTLDDPLGAELYRDVLERVWPEDGSLPMVPIEDYRRLMEHLDGLPPSTAAEIGRWIASKRRHLLEHKSWASGAFLTGDRLTVYACDHADNHDDDNSFVAELVALVTVRGIEIAEQGRPEVESAAIGVPRRGVARLQVRLRRPTPRHADRHPAGDGVASRCLRPRHPPGRRVDVGRNSRCPCGSGRKFKVCHGR